MVLCMATNIIKKKCLHIRHYKNSLLIGMIGSTLALTACSSPVGDFGRIDARNTRQITESHGTLVQLVESSDFLNPLNFSKTEKKFRLTAYLLMQSKLTSPVNEQITQQTAINHFIAIGLSKMQDRHQAISADIGKLHNILHSFQKLGRQVLAQDNMRDYANNPILNRKYLAAIDARHRDNTKLIQKTAQHLSQLHEAYIYVVNHSNIVEPTLNDAKLRNKLARFHAHVNELNWLY